jgi:hypothetical protein
MPEGVAILGTFVADLAFRAGRLPAIGETIAGSGFRCEIIRDLTASSMR